MNTKDYEEKLIHLANLKAKDFYGETVPEPVQQRLDEELEFIVKNKLALIYMFAYEAPRHLQKCIIPMAISDYTLVAFLLGLTEVDPLPPHYLCTCCEYIEFPFGFDTEKTEWNMPHKPCPHCLENLHIHGYSVEMPLDTNPNIVIEHASKSEKQEIIDFATKFFDEYRLVYGVALDELSPDWDEKIANYDEYEENYIYLLPKEDIINHNFEPIKADLPIISDDEEELDNYSFIYFSYYDWSHDYLSRKMKERAGVGSFYMYLDDSCARSLFSSTKVLGIEDDEIIDTGTLDIPFFMDKDIRSKLKGAKFNNFTELLCAYEKAKFTNFTERFCTYEIISNLTEPKQDRLHSDLDVRIVISALKLAFYKANYTIDYYMTMLEFYKDSITPELITQDDEELLKSAEQNDDRLAAVLYEMRKRNIKLLPINKYRSKEFEFTEYRDNTCWHGILPPLSLLPENKVGVWDNNGFLVELKYSDEIITISGIISEVIYENSENGYAVFEIMEEDDTATICKGFMPELNLDDSYILKGRMREDKKYGDYFEVTEHTFDCLTPQYNF